MSPERQPDSLALAREVDALCDRFEEALRAGNAADWYDWLPSAAPARARALAELAGLDLEHRLRAGEGVRVEAYLARCPELIQDIEAELALIVREYQVRRQREPELTLAEYHSRFPELSAHLRRFDRSSASGLVAPSTASGVDEPGRQSRAPDPAQSTNSPIGRLRIEMPRGRYFGEYELLEVIAQGGMGAVYRARQVTLNRIVALKMILTGHLANPEQVRRFRTEAEQAANLDHPHIVPIYEVGEHDGQQYYTMRFVEGTSLAGRARGEPRREAACLATVARAVHHAHQRGILHRDLKPSNILMDSAGTPHVADFGLAKRIAGPGGAGVDLTTSGALIGTPRYMAPEQAAGRRDLSVAVDVFSLGVVFYERLTGRPPFTGDSMLELLRQVREDEPPRPSSIVPRLDRDLETICLKCLEKDPAKRYGSAEELAEEVDRWTRGEPILARPVGQAARLWRWCRRNPAVAALAAGLLLALVAIATVSTGLALQARRLAAADRERADAERQGRQRAEKAEREAAQQRERADNNFRKTRQAIDRYFTLVSESRLLTVAGAEPLRKELLAAALEYYRNFPKSESDDAEVEAELAATYFRMAQIQNGLLYFANPQAAG
jgi:tRNA A-37 threonylcarbamoyl transferase component Bud32